MRNRILLLSTTTTATTTTATTTSGSTTTAAAASAMMMIVRAIVVVVVLLLMISIGCDVEAFQLAAPVIQQQLLHVVPSSSSSSVRTQHPQKRIGSSISTSVIHAKSRRQILDDAVVIATAVVLTTTTMTPEPTRAATAATAATATVSAAAVGKKAPTFVLPNSRSITTTVSLDQLVQSKKWTVLYFYPGAFTQGCTLEARAFQRDIDTYRALNAQIVGVSVDPPEKNAQFCSSEGLDFYMLSDIGGRVSKLYNTALSIPGFGTFANRQTYLIDPTGNLRYIFTDVESRIARHSGEVIEKLKELEQINV